MAVVQPFRYIYSLTVSKRRNLRDEKCSYFKSLSSMMLGFGGQNVKCQIEPSWRPNVSSIHSEIHKLTLTHDFTQRGCAWSRPILYKLRYYSIHKKTYVKPYLNPYLSVIITALLFFISPCHRRTFSDLGLIRWCISLYATRIVMSWWCYLAGCLAQETNIILLPSCTFCFLPIFCDVLFYLLMN